MKLIPMFAVGLLMLSSSLSFAGEEGAKDPRKFKSTDGTYEVTAVDNTLHRCRKDNFFMDYKVYDDQKESCVLTYRKAKCLKLSESTCADDQWQIIQEEKVIASAQHSKVFCHEKAHKMIDGFRAQGFMCTDSDETVVK